MEWWLVLLVILVAIAIVVHDNWRAYPVWWRTSERVRAEREAKRAGATPARADAPRGLSRLELRGEVAWTKSARR